MKKLIILLGGLAVFALAGCNTTEGIGEDIESVGDEIDESASD